MEFKALLLEDQVSSSRGIGFVDEEPPVGIFEEFLTTYWLTLHHQQLALRLWPNQLYMASEGDRVTFHRYGNRLTDLCKMPHNGQALRFVSVTRIQLLQGTWRSLC